MGDLDNSAESARNTAALDACGSWTRPCIALSVTDDSGREGQTSHDTTWLRRAVTIPGLVVLWLLGLALFPLTLGAVLVVDLWRGRGNYAMTRFQLAFTFALSIHVLGLVLLFAGWLDGVAHGRSRERDLDARSEIWWANAIWSAAERIYGMRVVVQGETLDQARPVVILSRHASLLDVLLPLVFVSGRHDLVPRYVAKRELLWDPCVDLVGHRLATAFVRRGGRAHDVDVAAVRGLARNLGGRDAVILFPEGTRFSPEKRARALAELAGKDAAAFAKASQLRNVLPPRIGGALGVLEHATSADVVFCAHTGLEGASHLGDLLAGSLIGATVHVRYWRVPVRDVPLGTDARIAWLWSWWKRIDDWIEECGSVSPPATHARLDGSEATFEVT